MQAMEEELKMLRSGVAALLHDTTPVLPIEDNGPTSPDMRAPTSCRAFRPSAGSPASPTDSPKKIENLTHAVSLHYMHYNFARPHKALGRRVTPAIAAGVAEYPWTTWDIAHLLDD